MDAVGCIIPPGGQGVDGFLMIYHVVFRDPGFQRFSVVVIHFFRIE